MPDGLPPSRTIALERADGAIRLGFERRDGRSALVTLRQAAPLRALFADVAPEEPPQAILINTSGGLVGGDRLAVEIALGAGAETVLTTQAAEKVYGSLDAGETSLVANDLALGPGSFLEWLPQETILFDRARLRRRFEARLAGDARLLAGEILLLGRAARGERFTRGLLFDRWTIRDAAGRPVWTDALRLDGEIAAVTNRRFGMGGAAAMATLLYAGPGAAALLEAARSAATAEKAVESGATLVNGLLLLRFLGDDGQALRSAFLRVAQALRAALGRAGGLPRSWSL